MVWFLRRDQQSLVIETRYDHETQDYVVTVTGASGKPKEMRFKTAVAFRAWLRAMDRDLTEDHWTQDGERCVLPEGWPDKPPLM